MAFELYINGSLVDHPIGADIVTSHAVNMLGDLKSRDGIYSNTFVCPETNNNKLIFQNAQLVLSGASVPYEKLEAIIKDTGVIKVIGFAQLISCKKGFKINVVGGNAEWFSDMGNESLNNLYLQELNHKWEDAIVYAQRTNIWSDGGNYPNADYGEFQTATSTNIDFNQLYWGVYSKWLMKKLFQDAGFTLSGDWWSANTLFAKQFIPFSGQWKRDKRYEQRDRFSVTIDNTVQATDLTSLAIPDIQTTNGTTTTECDYDFVPSKQFDYVGFSGISVQQGDHHLILDGGELTVNYNLTFNRNVTPAVDLLAKCSFIYVDENGNGASYLIADLSAAAASSTGHNFTGSFTLTVGRGAIFFSIGDLFIVTGSTFDAVLVANEADENDLYIDDTFSWVTVGSTLPEMGVLDFLRTIWNQFGIIFTTDTVTGFVKIFTLDEVQLNITNAEDWSDKIDLSEDPEVSFQMEGYGQSNYFRYAGDDTDEFLSADPTYGEGVIEVADENMPKEVEIFVSSFAPVKRIDSFDGDLVMGYIPKFIDGDENTCTPRICYIEFDGDNQITIGANGLEATQPQLYFDDLRFSVLLPLYNVTLINMLTNSKVVSALFRMTTVDIANLDYSRPKYVAHFGCYFWLNEVQQYNHTKPQSTMLNIIKI